jgi:ketosteroid isomerase-like protein
MNTRQLVETYHHAWTTGDFAAARACLADDLDFRGSIDAFKTADAFIATLRPFTAMLRRVTLLKACFDQDGAALLYDCDTVTPAGVIRSAEFFTTKGGKISEIRLVFDASELRKLMPPTPSA